LDYNFLFIYYFIYYPFLVRISGLILQIWEAKLVNNQVNGIHFKVFTLSLDA